MAGKDALFLVTFSTENLKTLANNSPSWRWFSGIGSDARKIGGNILAGAGFGYDCGRFLRVNNVMSESDFKNMDSLTLLFKLKPGHVKRIVAPPGVQYDVREIKAYAGGNPKVYELYYDTAAGDYRGRLAEAFTSDFELTNVTAPKDGYRETLPSDDLMGSVVYTGRPKPAEVSAGSLPDKLKNCCTEYTTKSGVVGYSGNLTDLFFQVNTIGELQRTPFGDLFAANTPNYFLFNNGLDSRQVEIKKTVVDEAGSPIESDLTYTVSVELGANGTAKPTSLTWKASGGADSDKSGTSGHIAVTAYKDGSPLPDGSALADADKITVTLMANDSVFLTFKGAFGSYCAITEENPGCAVTFKPSGDAPFYTAPGSAAVNGDLAGPTSDTAPTVYIDNGAVGSSKLEVVNAGKPASGITVAKEVMTGSWWPKEGGKYRDTAPGHVQFTYEGTERPTKIIFTNKNGDEVSAADVAYIADASGKRTGAASDSNLTASGTKSFCLVVNPKDSINVQFESDAPVKCSLREIPQTGEPSGGLAVDISNGTVFHPDAEMAQTGESSLENGLDMAPSQKYYCEIGPDATGGRITYTNSAEEIKGKASVIIDYNLNGLAASRVEDMGLSDLLVSGRGSNVVPVDGVYDLNDTVSMDLINKSLTNNGQPLKVGDVIKIPFSGRNTSGESVPLTLECKLDGVFADAKGTQKIDGAGYKITKPGTHVLYAHWTFTMTVDSSKPDHITSPSAQLKQIVWHDYWQGTTTTLYSYTTAETALGNGAIIDVGTNSGLLPAPIGRPGWSWYGWGDNASITWNDPNHMFKALWGQADADYYKQLKAFVDKIFARTGYATIDLFSYWTPMPYSFNGNGGYFGKIDPGDFDDGTWQSKNEVNAGQKDGQGNIYRIWAYADSEGHSTANDDDEFFYYMNFAVLPRVQPYRIGYAFDGWFYDAAATIPMQEFETGLQPDRWYFAGWAAEDVTVTYHDTREGYGTTYTKTYKYGEALELLRGITDTSGQHFAGWSTSPDSTDTLADGGYLMKSDPKMNGCWNLETGRPDDLGTTSAVNGLDDAFGGALTRHDADHSGTVDGGSDGGYYEPDADGGVTGTSHYWTLDLYSVWDPVTINYNDLNNNDRARPTKMTLGLVSSVTNQLVETKTVDVELTAPQQIVTFDNGGEGFPTTTADASVEKAAYRVYIKDYTDRNGKVHVIQDTTAQSGVMEMPTMSDGATTPVTSYAYALDNINQIDPGDAQLYTGQIYLNHNLVSTGTDVKFTLNFDDDSDNDGKRPSAVTLTLYADGKLVEGEDYSVVLSGDMTAGEWTYTFENLPVYREGESGVEIVYTISAEEAKPGDLYGTYTERGVLGEGHEFTKYAAEYPTKGGTFSPDLAESSEPMVRLTHELNQIEVPVSIVWQDGNNRDAQRPEYVNLALTAYQWNDETYKWEYVETAAKVVRTDGINSMTASEWTDTFGLQYMYHDGVKIIYHLAVTSDLNEFLPEGSYEYGWTETAHGNQVDAVPQVTISQNVNITSVTGTVFWDDSNNRDNIRPKNIVLQLYSHAPNRPEEKPEPVRGWAYRVNLSGDPKADNWTYTFTGMPKYDEGQSGIELVYTVRAVEAEGEPLYGYYIITANGGEEEVLRYEASYLHENREAGTTENTLDADLSDRAYVRLSHVCETKTMNLFANWHDGDNRDDMRPASVSVDLYKTVGNGEPTYLRTLVITEGSNGTWGYTVRDLPGYEDGQPVKYTIEVPEDVKAELEKAGYATTTEDNIVRLYHAPETGEVSTRLYWSDGDDNDGYRPDSVVAALYAEGAPTGRTADLNEGNGWSHTWTDLDVHCNQGAHGIGTMGQQ